MSAIYLTAKPFGQALQSLVFTSIATPTLQRPEGRSSRQCIEVWVWRSGGYGVNNYDGS